MSPRWVELVDGTPEPGAHAIVRDGLLVRWVNTGRAGADRWTWLAADELTSVGAHPRPVLLTWSAVAARGPLQLSLDAGGTNVTVLEDSFPITAGTGAVELQASVVDTDLRWRAAQLAVASSREACRDISGAAAVGAELVDLATAWEAYLRGEYTSGNEVFISEDEMERFRAWAGQPDRPGTAAGGRRDGGETAP